MIDKNMLNRDNDKLIMVEAVVRMALIECKIMTPEEAMVCERIDRIEEDIHISYMLQHTIECNVFVTINNETYKFYVALIDPETKTWLVRVFKCNTDKFNEMVWSAMFNPKRKYLVNKEIPSIDVNDLDNIDIDKMRPISYSTILDAMKRCNNPYFEIINQGSPVGMSTITKPMSFNERYIIAWGYALNGDKVNSFAMAHTGSLYRIGTDKNIYWLSIEKRVLDDITLVTVKKYINPNCDEVIYQAMLNIKEHQKCYNKSIKKDKSVDHKNVKKKDACISPKTARISKTEYYLSLAEVASKRGTCLRRKFGAVIVKDDRIVSTGYAGAPRGRINCCDRGVCARVENNVPSGERYELCRSVHAEANAIINASIEEMNDSTLYLVGMENDGSFTENAEPCAMCERMIINAGIKTVIVRTGDDIKDINVKDWIDDDDSLDYNHKGY